ncbi:PrgI family protein [Candidatus Parcubacteria bacterium]|nr:PrgI family protein [Patescibacteria group bacterium]MBU4466566.1 PrgI family protein [Patescibacteria group bacterium]MCG2688659.1 PrgI family protein [Candidatus Parcubacteria bacterium]
MRFQVPQFIEKESKIAGPLTFKQFALMGGAGVGIVILYAALAKTNFLAFAFLSTLLTVGAIALGFVRVGGRSLPVVLGNFILYSFSSRIYLWKRKDLPPRIVWQKLEDKSSPVKPEPLSTELRVAKKSRLGRVSSIVETKK